MWFTFFVWVYFLHKYLNLSFPRYGGGIGLIAGVHFKHFLGEVETAVFKVQSALTHKGVAHEVVEDKQRFIDNLFNRELQTLYLPKSSLYIRVRSHRFCNSAMLGVSVEIGAVTIQKLIICR